MLRGIERRLGRLQHPVADILYDQVLPDALGSIRTAMTQTGFKDPLFDTIFQSQSRRSSAVGEMTDLEGRLFDIVDRAKTCSVTADDLDGTTPEDIYATRDKGPTLT